jgi:Ser/Thr protein kinase RdoA (MazF antagonist)
VTIEETLEAIGRVVRRAPYAYRTSWPLEEVELVVADGSALHLLVKRFEDADLMKPAFVVDPAREVEVYRLLDGALLGTPHCYAAGPRWIAIEKVPGIELWQCDGHEGWRATARWAARLHASFVENPPSAHALLDHDEAYYRQWVERAQAAAGSRVKGLAESAEGAITRLCALPRTLIHGELYASNVIVAGERIAAVDWEMAALGPGVIDVAALTTGWPRSEQRSLCDAYGEVEPKDVAAARLLLALQWVGWFEGWEAPPEHRRDWIAEALDAAEELADG